MTRLYIIEDETLLRELVCDMLAEKEGFEVVGGCGDGTEGLAACLSLKPDMLVTDMRVPGMDGVEIARRLREKMPDVKVLLFSGMFNVEIIRRALMAKINGIIEKKAGLAEMDNAIRAVAAGQSFFGDIVVRSMPDLVGGSVPAHPVETLTSREREILCMIAEGLSTRDIATRLSISARTADVHRTNIMTKLDAHNVVSLTRIAIACGLVSLPA
jgi:DNA-binding NarL/FixJ family response regulator